MPCTARPVDAARMIHDIAWETEKGLRNQFAAFNAMSTARDSKARNLKNPYVCLLRKAWREAITAMADSRQSSEMFIGLATGSALGYCRTGNSSIIAADGGLSMLGLKASIEAGWVYRSGDARLVIS